MNYKLVAEELINFIDTALENSEVVIPFQKGNSIRIKNYAIRKNSKGYQIFDCATNTRVAVTNFKISAVALAKSLAEGKKVQDKIMRLDAELLKHYNDAVFFRNRISKAEDSAVVQSRLHRLDISVAKSQALKYDLDKFIF